MVLWAAVGAIYSWPCFTADRHAGLPRWSFPFVVIGMNAIVAYMAQPLFDVRHIGRHLFGGLAAHLGPRRLHAGLCDPGPALGRPLVPLPPAEPSSGFSAARAASASEKRGKRMYFRPTFITGLSLLFISIGLYLSFAGADGGKRYFFTTLGILGWFIGNRLVELDERISELEKSGAGRQDRGVGAPRGPDGVAGVIP